MEKRTVMLLDYWVSPLYNSKVPQRGPGWIGVCKSDDPFTKSALPFSPWIRNPGKNIWITRKVQNPGPKNRSIPDIRCNCRIRKFVKSRFESEIRAKIISKSADPFAYNFIFTPSSNLTSKDLDIADVYILVKAWRLCSVASGAGDYVVLAGKKNRQTLPQTFLCFVFSKFNTGTQI